MGRKSKPLTVKIAYTHIEEGKEPYYTYEDQYTKEEIIEHFLKANDIALAAAGSRKITKAV
jgi:hypothetical protein